MARRKKRRRRNGVREVRTLSRFARARMLRGTRRLARLAGMSPRSTDALSQARSWRASYGRRNPADSGKVDARRRIRYVVTYQGQPVPGAITLKRAEAWRWADRLTRQTGYLYAVGLAAPGVPLPRRNPGEGRPLAVCNSGLCTKRADVIEDGVPRCIEHTAAYAAALRRLNLRQQARNVWTAITPAHVRREMRRHRS